MATIGDMMRRFDQLDVIELAGESMYDNRAEILDINREQLYEQGIGKDGQPLPPYSPPYAKIKQRQRGKSIVDIYRRGNLQREMELYVREYEYEITSMVEYTKYVANLRPTIFGLTTEGKKEAYYIIRPDLVRKIKSKLNI
jgi:hypothetical protein